VGNSGKKKSIWEERTKHSQRKSSVRKTKPELVFQKRRNEGGPVSIWEGEEIELNRQTGSGGRGGVL